MSPSSLILATIFFAIFLFYLLKLTTRCQHYNLPLPLGPKLWSIIGNLPHVGAVPHHSLARNYGPLMHLRLSFVDVVAVASASVASQFLKTHDQNFSSQPPNSDANYIAYNYQDLVFTPYGPRWSMLRKISSIHLFSGKGLG